MSSSMWASSPVDPDVDLHVPAQRAERTWDPLILTVIAVGGLAGAEVRYALSLLWPSGAGQWPGGTWWVNISGCLLLGALMVVLTELTSPHRLVRPFLGVGVLGGYTTFSTAMVEVHQLVLAGMPAIAMAYLLGTAAAGLVAVALGALGARSAATAWSRLRERARR
ncbi:MAG: CrcB family protein [Actinomycetota bacterium]|nr:CrcB family protein [Actinomycetota bacterium]